MPRHLLHWSLGLLQVVPFVAHVGPWIQDRSIHTNAAVALEITNKFLGFGPVALIIVPYHHPVSR